MRQSILDIAAERNRQIDQERFSEAHDDSHVDGDLAKAAVCYAAAGVETDAWSKVGQRVCRTFDQWWPWTRNWWKPTFDRRRNLVKAGALIAAEIDRIDRQESRS